MRIRQLPTQIANQIAAGEVIERPASVVKELLENALDAGANQISIDIGYGGLNHIKISDNGLGIAGEDLPLAIAAHATSKISELNDLYSISSMGFRGEALASIASISRLSISSKPPGQDNAMILVAEGGDAIRLSPCARSQGTTIDVRDIFFNAPVRKKFLKTAGSEFLAIEMIVKRFALSALNIAIQLTHNGKLHFNLPSANCDKSRLARIQKILGKAFIEQSCLIEAAHAELGLQGWVSTKDYQRSQTDKQLIYVNGRMVKDKLLNHALKQAYDNLLHPGRHPSCLLYLTINPAEVDVNVHPTKHELRFQQPRLVHDFISSQIQQVLQSSPLQVDYSPETVIEKTTSMQVFEPYSPLPLGASPIPAKTKPWFVLNRRFVLHYLQDKPHLVDLITIQKNWLYSQLMEQSIPLASRPLLVPVSHKLMHPGSESFKEYSQNLKQVGLECSLASENTILIRTLPTLVPHLQLQSFLASFFNEKSLVLDKSLELLASHQSFDAPSATQDEMETLMAFISHSYEKLPDGCRHLSLDLCMELVNA